jgi:sugar O-acyltransferase (sialic acid O-acetyltransferase NeuD family)
MKKILLFPFNGNAKEAASIIEEINELSSTWEIIGFVDDDVNKIGQEFGGYSVIGGRESISMNPESFVLAVPGRPENYLQRKEAIHSLNIPESRFATVIHPQAMIGINCTVGYNSLLMVNVVLTANTTVGNNVVILPNTVLSHDSKVGDYSLLGSNISVSGAVTIERNCYIGSGTKIIQEVTIGEESLVGIGSVVIDDISPRSVAVGNPARLIREMQ